MWYQKLFAFKILSLNIKNGYAICLNPPTKNLSQELILTNKDGRKSLLISYLIHSRVYIAVVPTSLFSLNHFIFFLSISILSTETSYIK